MSAASLRSGSPAHRRATASTGVLGDAGVPYDARMLRVYSSSLSTLNRVYETLLLALVYGLRGGLEEMATSYLNECPKGYYRYCQGVMKEMKDES